ncbi:MAG: hypothetical protein JO061_21410, partial [Acidobacteriaceae bacterium]|nr:hypothetical protein [Acidobacteriaceae bacterium]
EFVRQFTILLRLANQVWFVAVPSAGWISQANNLQGLCRTYTNLLVARVRTLRGVSVLNWPTSVSADESTDRETDRLDHIPFTEDACYKLGEWVGDEIARGIAQSSDKVITSGTGRSELAAYLASLQVRIDLAPPRASERPHVDHILRTAASFSLTGENPIISEHEIDAVLRSARCLVISVSDRISDCGPSGLIAFSISGDVLIVNRFALSCRVLGKQVEYAAVSALASIAAERACTRIEFAYVETPRNQPMVAFLQQVARRSREGAYVLPAGDVEAKIIQTAVNPSAWTLNTPDLAEHDVLVGSSLEQQQ